MGSRPCDFVDRSQIRQTRSSLASGCLGTWFGGALRRRRWGAVLGRDEGLRRQASPCITEELAQIGRRDLVEANEDRGEAVVVGLGEELVGVGGEERRLFFLVANADGEDGGLGTRGLSGSTRSFQTQAMPFGLGVLSTANPKCVESSRVPGRARAMRRTSAWVAIGWLLM